MKRALLLLVLASGPAPLLADEVFLKGGGKVSGRIVNRTGTSVEVDVGAGIVTLPMARVERIQEGRSALQDYYDRASALGPGDSAGWKELARWASSRGLATQAREAYERVLRIDPTDRDANLARGNVELEGRWVSEAEGYRARGFVEFEGRWVTPTEQEAILQQRAAESEAARGQRAMDAQVREAEARAREAEARARSAEADANNAGYADEGIPLWWGGGWGPGPGIWPPVVDTTPGRVPRSPSTGSNSPRQPRPQPHPQPTSNATPAPSKPMRPPGGYVP
ncbi:MAG TPA: hypothetical protein VIC87_07335, partial [Vicinamibacteria bacterium]